MEMLTYNAYVEKKKYCLAANELLLSFNGKEGRFVFIVYMPLRPFSELFHSSELGKYFGDVS